MMARVAPMLKEEWGSQVEFLQYKVNIRNCGQDLCQLWERNFFTQELAYVDNFYRNIRKQENITASLKHRLRSFIMAMRKKEQFGYFRSFVGLNFMHEPFLNPFQKKQYIIKESFIRKFSSASHLRMKVLMAMNENWMS